MLHLETVEPGTFAILKHLMEVPELKDFALVGGTALSLLYGHRTSVDLDLFSSHPFENQSIIDSLQKKIKKSYAVRTKSNIGIFGFIDGLKIDIVKHPHPLIRPERNIEGIRMFSIEDLMAMKIQAILNRGRKKDFWDIAELLKHYPVSDFVQFHEEKYSSLYSMITVPQAMTYFKDADDDPNSVSLKNRTWSQVQSFISKKVREYLI